MNEANSFVYFGSSEFSAVILGELCQREYRPLIVVTKPDKPKGRGLRVLPTAVSRIAGEYSLRCLKPHSLADPGLGNALREANTDFFVVADYGNIIPVSLLDVPRYLSLCVHPSLLPRYRGPAPIEYALLNGETSTGITIFRINQRVDAGEIISQKEVAIEDSDDYCCLRQKLARQSIELLLAAMQQVVRGTYTLTPQDERKASYTHKLTKNDGNICWHHSARAIYNRIRATTGWPSAYTYYKGKLIQILAAAVLDEPVSSAAGTVVRVDKKGFAVATGEGLLEITSLKPQGKKEMDAWAFACGYHLKGGERLGKAG